MEKNPMLAKGLKLAGAHLTKKAYNQKWEEIKERVVSFRKETYSRTDVNPIALRIFASHFSNKWRKTSFETLKYLINLKSTYFNIQAKSLISIYLQFVVNFQWIWCIPQPTSFVSQSIQSLTSLLIFTVEPKLNTTHFWRLFYHFILKTFQINLTKRSTTLKRSKHCEMSFENISIPAVFYFPHFVSKCFSDSSHMNLTGVLEYQGKSHMTRLKSHMRKFMWLSE